MYPSYSGDLINTTTSTETGGEYYYDTVLGYVRKKTETLETKPEQYQIGIDTFTRAEANMNFEELMACCRFNIDKYNWRVKGQDLEDFKKIIAYANFAIKQLEK